MAIYHKLGVEEIELVDLFLHNNENSECGTGAVVPWAGKLWLITYGSHFPHGSGDKLYEITPDLEQIVREDEINVLCTPAPGAALLALLGFGSAGLKLRRRKNRLF